MWSSGSVIAAIRCYLLGASFGKNVSVPTMFPRPNDANVIALIVTFLVWPAVLLELYA